MVIAGAVQILLDTRQIYVYTYTVCVQIASERHLPVLPCACANLRRAARAVTRMYNRELRPTGLELTQFTLLMALNMTGETTQGKLGRLLALDSTSLTRMLRPMTEHGWVGEKTGEDRRQKLLRLTASGRTKLQQSWPYWEGAQARLKHKLGEPGWSQMGSVLAEVLAASAAP